MFFLANAKRKLALDEGLEEQLDNIEIDGKPFMREKISLNEGEKDEAIRIYATIEMLDILEDKNFTHFFLDGTFKCVPKG